jgi:hypothetical protein
MEWGGNGEVSSRATWGQGGRDRTTQQEVFQVSKRELAEGSSKGLSARGAPSLNVANLCIRIISCMNAANKRMC